MKLVLRDGWFVKRMFLSWETTERPKMKRVYMEREGVVLWFHNFSNEKWHQNFDLDEFKRYKKVYAKAKHCFRAKYAYQVIWRGLLETAELPPDNTPLTQILTQDSRFSYHKRSGGISSGSAALASRGASQWVPASLPPPQETNLEVLCARSARSGAVPPSNRTPKERSGLNGPSSRHRCLQRSIRRPRARRTDSVFQAPGTVVLLLPPRHRTPLWTPVLFPVSLLPGSCAPRRSLSLRFSSCLYVYAPVLSSCHYLIFTSYFLFPYCLSYPPLHLLFSTFPPPPSSHY